jgi:mono/diheme cytochrome c family protein
LRNAFGRIGRTVPTYRKQALPDMFAANILPSMDKLDAAIKAKDGAAFDAAYKEVTASCNNCHGALDHGFVVIREPTSSPYADQTLTGGAGGSKGKAKAKAKAK